MQDDDLIKAIHEEELPPDEYYDRLKEILRARHPKVAPTFVDHVVAVGVAFDTAAAFGLSFGIKKFQLAQREVKLVGELISREGRKPNPAQCVSIRNWPPIRTLKDLPSFLGTTNYCQARMGPSNSLKMHPLKPLLGKDAVFPPNEVHQKAIEELKELAIEDHLLAVPNERAAMEAANAWQAGLPAASLPYEAGADTSKIAMGGAFGQAEEKDGRLRILMYWSDADPSSPTPPVWAPKSELGVGSREFGMGNGRLGYESKLRIQNI